ncbi:hypothetical protein A2276_08635 [candidate division WOR-1 bacterium RIFOXYA12_FULL_43_27]|nr:MAG: hypothetical protein A2276_08635 [candidate division WOR-1 bacterium RIFOXYA12_FULL_43_27]
MSDKALISDAELELTQKIQMHFPRGVIPAEVLMKWNGCPKDIITAKLTEVFGQSPMAELLLDPVGTVIIPATTSRFIACEKFVCDTSRKAEARISYLGDFFTECFLGDDGKVEEPIGKQTLRYARLKKASVDDPIITEQGGEAKVETTLTEMFSLMEKQKDGEAGVLLNNGYANIFYIRDKNGVLRAALVLWFGDGWRVYASSVEYPLEWFAGYRVFSRIPVDA